MTKKAKKELEVVAVDTTNEEVITLDEDIVDLTTYALEDMINFGLDTGKMNTQLVGANNLTDIIPSRIEIDSEGTFGNKVSINGRICEISVDSPYSDNHSKNEEHSIFLGWYMISRNVKSGSVVNVGIGLPLDIYKNIEERTRFAENFLNGNKPIYIDDKHFTINKVLVCPEGVSATTQHRLKRNTAVIDMGGRNVGMAIVDEKGRVIKESINTYDEGMHKAIKNLRFELRSDNITGYEEENLRNIIFNGGANKIIKSKMDKFFGGYLKRIKNKIDKELQGFIRSTTDLLFVGGTSKYLEETIKSTFENANLEIEDEADKYTFSVSEDALWDNPKAYLALLLNVLGIKG